MADAPADAIVAATARTKYQRDENNRFIVPLKKPVKVTDTMTVSELRVREPEAGDLRGINLQNIMSDHLLNIAAKVSGQASTVIDKLSLEDAMEVGELIADFLPDGLFAGMRF